MLMRNNLCGNGTLKTRSVCLRELTVDEMNLVNGSGWCEGNWVVAGAIIGGVVGSTAPVVGTAGGIAWGATAGVWAGDMFC